MNEISNDLSLNDKFYFFLCFDIIWMIIMVGMRLMTMKVWLVVKKWYASNLEWFRIIFFSYVNLNKEYQKKKTEWMNLIFELFACFFFLNGKKCFICEKLIVN